MAEGGSIAARSGDGIEMAARAGYGARGLIYLIIGYFAFRSAFAGGGEAMGSTDAIDKVVGSGFGTLLLWLLAAALAGFALWRLVQAWRDLDGHGTDARGLAVRAGLLGSAAAHASLAAYAGTLAFGAGESGGGAGGVVAAAYEAGFGRWATFLAALVLTGVGVAHIVKGARSGFEKHMDIPAAVRGWLCPACRFGLVARGVTFLVIAMLLATGAARYSEGDTPGLEAALTAIGSWPFGWALLSLTGLGLLAFGVYALAEARYRRVRV